MSSSHSQPMWWFSWWGPAEALYHQTLMISSRRWSRRRFSVMEAFSNSQHTVQFYFDVSGDVRSVQLIDNSCPLLLWIEASVKAARPKLCEMCRLLPNCHPKPSGLGKTSSLEISPAICYGGSPRFIQPPSITCFFYLLWQPLVKKKFRSHQHNSTGAATESQRTVK